MKDKSDEALMLSYAAGNADAFDALYARYRSPLYRYFLRHTSEAIVANDLYQGCWEKVIAARKRYQDRSPFKAWLFRIAHNHLVDHYRAQRKEDPLPPDLIDPQSHSPEADMDKADRQAQLNQAIASLPRDQRDTLLLRMEGGLSLAQLAEATGVNQETAKSRLRYATGKLKELLQP